jgi:hypothetical protein
MNGAREYAAMFSTGQYGRLYLQSGSHARGATFHIYVLPANVRVKDGQPFSADVVEVYGITGGRPGWTETYGWLHKGKWQDDFAELVKARRAEIEAYNARKEQDQTEAKATERDRKAKLLETYK